MKTVEMIARFLLGFAMLIFGANKFLNFMPAQEVPEAAGAFLGALASSGYIFPTLGIIYILAGLLLIVNKAIPFALIILVPVSFNIVAFHLKFDPQGILFAAIIAALNLFLIYTNCSRLKSLFE